MFFLKKVGGALWVYIWNQGGGGPKILGTTDIEGMAPSESYLTRWQRYNLQKRR
jgi:hypothetical protein